MGGPRRHIVPLFIPHEGCPHACSFCDQRAISGEGQMTPEKAAEALRQAFSFPHPADTEIAFFGGSFTCLARERMEAYLEAARPYLESGRAASVRCSTRPDGVAPDILPLLREYRVRTVELGAQSFSDRVLALNGRGHTAAQIENAFYLLRQNGFAVGLQIMTGLPGETAEDLALTVESVCRLRPDMLRIYPAAVLDGTPMARWMREGTFIPKGVEEQVSICAPILARMEREGIPVIRVGLHPSAELERKVVGGCCHPAFKELCLSRLWREKAASALAGFPAGTAAELSVPAKALSQALGQKRENIGYWGRLGYRVRVSVSPDGGAYLAAEGKKIPLREEYKPDAPALP